MFSPFERSGIGLHTGEQSHIRVSPRKSPSGICFVTDGVEIAASPERLAASPQLATSVGRQHRTVSTVEHLLAALAAAGETDVIIEVDGPEIPILDGSAAPWYRTLLAHGATPGFCFFELPHPLEVRSAGSHARLIPEPRGGTPRIDVTVDFEGLPEQYRRRVFRPNLDDFSDIAEARTFAFEKDIEKMRTEGLAKGGSLDNALVLGNRGPLNPEGMRFSDEPVRHKLVDAIGDLMILGALPFASIQLVRPGHHLMHELVRQLALIPQHSPVRSL